MLIVETVGRIRREHFVKGRSIKEIARDLRISRNTVRRILRSGETSFSYVREVQPRPRLGRWKADLDRMLTTNAGNTTRERLTLIRLFEQLQTLGYQGGYDAVRRYARTWSREHASHTAAAFIPLSLAPGEAYQFDWSHDDNVSGPQADHSTGGQGGHAGSEAAARLRLDQDCVADRFDKRALAASDCA